MPRSMADPNYQYRPWSADQRQRASQAAKERWAKRKREAAKAIPPTFPKPREDLTFGEKFSLGRIECQHDLLKAWLNLIILYRQRPSDPEFMVMLADRWEEMVRIVAEELRHPVRY